MFDYDNSLRVQIFNLVKSAVFEGCIVVFVLFTSIHLALFSPLSDPNGKYAKTLYWVDFGTTFVFLAEFILKVIAFGLLCNGKHSYLRSYWNNLDFIIVVLSLLSLNDTI